MPHTSLQPALRRGIAVDCYACKQKYWPMLSAGLSVGFMAYVPQINRRVLPPLALAAVAYKLRRQKSQAS